MTDNRFGVLLAISAGIVWSTIGLSIKSIEQANAFEILFYRSIFISVFIGTLLHFFFRFDFWDLFKNWVSYLIGGTSLFFAYIGGIYALLSTSAANALLLFACAPIFTAILSPILLKEAISIKTLLSIFIAFLGVFIMIWNDFGGGNWKGNLSAVISAIGFSFFTINLRLNKHLQMLPSVFSSGIIASCVALLIILLADYSFGLISKDFIIIFILGVFQVGGGLVLYTVGSKYVPATQLTILMLGEVFLGPVWVWIFIGEEVLLNTILGGSMICFAVIYNALYSNSEKSIR
ncbi:MAG: membrane protein [Paracoccaceae bacterium]|nr:MAG: membrane protein [Paracoccaceae bacterium]